MNHKESSNQTVRLKTGMVEVEAPAFTALQNARYPVHKIASQVEPYLRQIVLQFHPEKIILFGSQAYGRPSEHSDIDMLVVRRGIYSENASNLEIRQSFWELRGCHNLPLTILSKTPEDLSERLAQQSPFYQDIVGKGVVVYDREHG